MADPVGLVLAGGLGLRMGRTKGDLEFRGERLAARAAGMLAPVCRGVLISIRTGALNPAPGFPAIEDPEPAGRGPLVGIQAAQQVAGEADLLVLACDYPRVGSDLLRRLLALSTEQDDLVLLTDAGSREHPLVGLWRRSTAGLISEALADGRYRVRELLGDCNVRRLGPGSFPGVDLDLALVNLNTPSELGSAEGGSGS